MRALEAVLAIGVFGFASGGTATGGTPDAGEARSIDAYEEMVLALAFAPDGQSLVSGGAAAVTVWDVDSLASVAEYRPEGATVSSVSFFPDGERIVFGTTCGRVGIWNSRNGDVDDVVTSEKWAVVATAVSPDGKSLAAVGAVRRRGYRSGAAVLWDVHNDEVVATLRGHDAPIVALAFCDAGRLLVTGDMKGAVYLWSTDTGERIGQLVGRAEFVAARGVACAEQGATLAIGAYPPQGDETKAVELWDMNARRLGRHLPGHAWGAWSLALSANGETLAAGSMTGTVKVWTGPDWKEQLEAKAHTRAVDAVAVTANGAVVATGGRDGVIKLWHVRE